VGERKRMSEHNFDIIFRIKSFFSGGTGVKEEAEKANKTLNEVNDNLDQIDTHKPVTNENLRVGIRMLSTMQLLRFTVKDISDITSGKGGLADMLSLSTNLLLLTINLNYLLKEQIKLESALAVIQSTRDKTTGALTGVMGKFIGDTASKAVMGILSKAFIAALVALVVYEASKRLVEWWEHRMDEYNKNVMLRQGAYTVVYGRNPNSPRGTLQEYRTLVGQ